MSIETETNERLLFLAAAHVNEARLLVQRAWDDKVLTLSVATMLKRELGSAAEMAGELHRRAAERTPA